MKHIDAQDWLDAEMHPAGIYDEDVMAQDDTISIEELEEEPHSQMSAAGLDDLTPVDTFISMNGDTRYVTDL